jgi:hypothetical protein
MPQTSSRDRVLVSLVVAIIVLFQSHWLDDVGSGQPDAAGRIVSAVATLALAAGLILRNASLGRALLAFALLFTAFVSVADLIGFRADGTRTMNIWSHWRRDLGWVLTATVMISLLLAVLALSQLARSRPARSLPT